MSEIDRSPVWRRSGGCGSSTCVEVARVGDNYLVRDSKNPDTTPLSFTADEWQAFVQGVKGNEFDRL
uniref:Putative regulatory protein n=1 Tax=uncultured bacterium BAC AB649/1850 TaxID=1037453 RepID=F6K0Z8_9BACT|nr:putative regulatory protein [uncultured bacterium BAC AB649/1850]